MFNSLRIKLTIWYSAILALVLIVFAVGVYFLLEQTVKQTADDSLEDASDSLITRLQNNQDVTNESIQQTLEDFRFQYIVFAIFDKDKKVFAASPRIQKDSKLKFPTFNISVDEIPQNVLNNLFQITNKHETFLFQNKTNIRTFHEKTEIDEKTLHVVTLRPLTNQTELLSNIRLILLAGIPLAILFSIIGGYYLARKALEPVLEMNEKTSYITHHNLHERLPTGKNKNEVEKLAVTFNELLERLENSFDLQKRFMADASHELRTPLAIMRGEAEVSLQKETRDEEDYRESMEVIRQEGVRLSHIVEDLFILARADSNQYKLNISTFYLDELVKETGKAVRTLVANKNLEFELKTDENLIFEGDETLIRRLVIILLDNAIKYSNKGGKISLDCTKENSNYKIKVSNTGTPIPKDEQTKIFERFYRADKVRSHKEDYELGTGAGLGLSMGMWIAEIHEGDLKLEKSNEKETIFTISLPKNEKNT